MLDRTMPWWPCGRALARREQVADGRRSGVSSVVLPAGGRSDCARSKVVELVNSLFTASSSGCSGSLVVARCWQPPRLMPTQLPWMKTCCPKQGWRPRRRFHGTFCRNTQESTKSPLRCPRRSRIWTRSSCSRSIAAYVEFRYWRVIASWLTM